MKVKEELVDKYYLDFHKNFVDVWYYGNSVLYDMCENAPDHKDLNKAVGKIWIIGRTYAAAIERIQKERTVIGDFYKNEVADCFKNNGKELDKRIEKLKSIKKLDFNNIQKVLAEHKWLMKEFKTITDIDKRSLVSKYLHFHLPNAFYIYDTRAVSTITKMVTKKGGKSYTFKGKIDDSYAEFCVRVLTLLEYIKEKYKKDLTPRELDNFLLYVDEKYFLEARVEKAKAKKAKEKEEKQKQTAKKV